MDLKVILMKKNMSYYFTHILFMKGSHFCKLLSFPHNMITSFSNASNVCLFDISRAVKINNCSNYDQSIKIATGLLYTIKIKFKRGAKIFEEEMTSFWLKLPNAWTRHRPKISFHQMMMNYSSLERQFDSSYVS